MREEKSSFGILLIFFFFQFNFVFFRNQKNNKKKERPRRRRSIRLFFVFFEIKKEISFLLNETKSDKKEWRSKTKKKITMHL